METDPELKWDKGTVLLFLSPRFNIDEVPLPRERSHGPAHARGQRSYPDFSKGKPVRTSEYCI